MIYKIIFSETANSDIRKLKRCEPNVYKKLLKFLIEIQEHPYTGTGHPKPLGEDRTGQWSRRITQKHRLIYEIREDIVTILVLSAYGHYGDK